MIQLRLCAFEAKKPMGREDAKKLKKTMKTLYLLRHGHAETKAKQPDRERNLDAEGRGEAERTGEKLKKVELLPQLIISSNYNRAYQTAEIAAKALDYNVK